jgi:hypothetical protein
VKIGGKRSRQRDVKIWRFKRRGAKWQRKNRCASAFKKNYKKFKIIFATKKYCFIFAAVFCTFAIAL